MTWIRRLALPLVIVLIAVTQIAATAPDSTSVAINIAAILLAIATPFLPLAQFHLDGPKMVALSMVLALAIAVVASFLTGELKIATLQGGSLIVLSAFLKLWAVQQAVFALLKDLPKLGPLLTDKPVLVAPAKP